MSRARPRSRSFSDATLPATLWATRPHPRVCLRGARAVLAICARHLRPWSTQPALLPCCPSCAQAGQKEQEANNFLEKRYKADLNPALSYDDTVQLALATLQNVLGSDLKAGDIEASVVRNEALNFTRLTNDEVEAQLTALAEREDDLSGKGE